MFLIFFVSFLITSEIDSLNTLIVKDSTKIDSIVNINQIQNDSIFFQEINDTLQKYGYIPIISKSNDLFYEQLMESKLTFADAITYDVALDTTEAEVQFLSLFSSFEFLDSLSLDDEYKRIAYSY